MEKNSFSVGLLKGLAEIFVFVCLIVPLVVQAEVVTEIIYGTLTSKSDNIGDEYEVATQYKLFEVTYDNTNTIMHEYNISDDTVVNANETMVGVYADAQYDILPSLSGFFDSYCTDSTWITYYDWYYYYNTGDSETTISQRQTEFYYFEFQSYPDGSSDQSGRVAGYIESVYSQLQFNQVLRVQKISPVINTTINGLDGFQIEGDFRSWLDLDNPNILGKSYNEIKAWAEENGFRFATEEDMADLRIAILPIGDVQNDTIDESQYTIEEQGFIGLTAATNFYNTTVG